MSIILIPKERIFFNLIATMDQSHHNFILEVAISSEKFSRMLIGLVGSWFSNLVLRLLSTLGKKLASLVSSVLVQQAEVSPWL